MTDRSKTKAQLLEELAALRDQVADLQSKVTRHKSDEEALRESEERFRSVFEGSLDSILLADPVTGKIIDANPAAEELLLMPREEIIGLHQSEVHPPRIREYAKGAFRRIIEEGDHKAPAETLLQASDGTEKLVEILAQVIQIDGRPTVFGVFRDISERKRVEQALLESEKKLSLVMDGVPWLICYVSSDQRYLYVNRAYADWYGTSPEQLVGKHVREVLDEQVYSRISGYIERALEGARVSFDDAAHDREGRERTLQATYVPHLDERGALKGFFVLIQDTTDQKRMEKEILKIQKLESLGVFAGGIAHDFNNLLTVVLANLSMARVYGDLGEETSGMLADAEKASLRAQALTQQLLAFSKGGLPTKKVVSLQKLLRETAEFTLAGSNVGCDFAILQDLWPVSVDEGQISQVVSNLVINADQAMPEGGTIRISAENAILPEEAPIPLQPGKYVKISVADQGVGISPKHLPKVFDPFFTTKKKGSGLGLSSSYTIIRNHGGFIRIDSEVDAGSTVVIHLPAAEAGLADAEPNEQGPIRGTGRILLIEDEEMIRRSTGRMLERLGYEVTLASDGEEGIDLYGKAMGLGRPFHLVILDLTIRRGMGGDQAMRELRRIDPDVKAIVSSGYSANPIMSSHDEHGFCGVVPKPYRIEELAESIHRVLTGNPR
jgi:PAS domain S-box-containing protein